LSKKKKYEREEEKRGAENYKHAYTQQE